MPMHTHYRGGRETAYTSLDPKLLGAQNLQAEKRKENPEDEHDHGATVGALVDAGVPGLLDDDDGLLTWGVCGESFGVRHGISHAHTVFSRAD